jgi:hypothetical protein
VPTFSKPDIEYTDLFISIYTTVSFNQNMNSSIIDEVIRPQR